MSLLIIAALGAASVVGIQASAIDMRDVADKLYKERNLYDIQLKSTMGFDEDDITAVQGAVGVETVMPAYIFDIYGYSEDATYTIRAYSLHDTLNHIELLEGRLPENAAECAVEERFLSTGEFTIGSTITLGLDDMDDYYEVLERSELTIVGVVKSPLYINLHERGLTSLGSGRLDLYIYLHPSAYLLDVYTDLYVQMSDSLTMYNLSDEYNHEAEGWLINTKIVGNVRVRAKMDELADARIEIDDGYVKYYDAVAELEELVKAGWPVPDDAWEELREAWAELEAAEAELFAAPTPEWFYFTRKDGVAFDSYYQDTLRLERIGFVFPLVFFLVAVMVTLTTMTRMVEEHRTQIGVYKALGYRTSSVMAKYLIYAFSAGTLGGLIGVAGGSYVFPMIITDAYGYLYDMPPVETPIPLFIGTLAVVGAVGSVAVVTWFTCLRAASHEPSVLMRPRPPKSGKRVILERIPIIWNRLSFIQKVTARNILRYKTRFFMTLIGVAGCSALLVTAFGLRDSIGSVSIEQFGRVIEYDARVFLKDITTTQQRGEIDNILGDTLSLFIREESVKATDAGRRSGEELEVSLIIPEDFDHLPDFVNLLSPSTGETMQYDTKGVIITEKLSKKTEVYAGDSMVVTLDDETYTVHVTGVVENYILNYMYMPVDVYRETFETDVLLNSAFIFSDDLDTLAYRLLANENVRAFSVMEDQMESISDSTDALGIVTIVLIVLACALALVVLFNLTNINITERIRELATIKVLGFYNTELSLYIYRENFIVTFLGIAIGTWAGLFLHGYILVTVEVDMLMFPRIINATSYVLAAALSAVFAVLVNIIMNFRLSSINMVESLKNVE